MKFCLVFLFTVTANSCYARFPPNYAFIESVPNQGDAGEPLILTPLLQKNKIEEAQLASKVNDPVFLNVSSYSGYFTVSELYNSNLFFWFFPALEDADNAPVLLWLQGGPGASSMYGLFDENGPFVVVNESELRLRNETWSRSHNLLYIDNPVGAGFSFTNRGYADNETKVGEDLYHGLQQFFTLFPKLQKNEFYISGESYAGKYIPAVSHTILKKNSNATLKINLKGVAIGNGLSDPEHQLLYGDRLFQLGLIDSNTKNVFKEQEKLFIKYAKEEESEKALEITSYLMLGGEDSLFYNATHWDNVYNYLESNKDSPYLGRFLTKTQTRKAIHVGDTPFGDVKVSYHLNNDMMLSVKSWVSQMLEEIKVMIFNGHLDLLVPYPQTVNFLKTLNFSSAAEYKVAERQIWKVNGEIAGYVKEAGNLVEVMVRNAGHMVPTDQPVWALDMITKFTRNKTLY